MRILALEFSSAQRSVAVVCSAPAQDTGAPGASEVAITEVAETGGRATRAFGMMEEALQQARLEREQIDALAIGLGPGSYTGIRAAIAVGQGWQFATGIRLQGVSSAESIAAQAQAEGLAGRVAIVIDAQRSEFYVSEYELGTVSYSQTAPLRLVTMAAVHALAETGVALAGPEIARWFPQATAVFPRASVVGRLALNRQEFVAGERLEPIYLRETKFVKAPPPRVLPI